jgi:iron complex outermembrane receptor protein
MTTIDRDQFKDQPAFSAGEILQQSPGVTIKQGNGPRDVGISIRGSNARNGFGVRNIKVYEDGFPVTQPDGLSRTDLTDPHAYGAIDVHRGPSSALFGNYATGGAVNFHTRAGGDIDGLELGMDAGSFGYLNGYGAYGGRGDGWEYALFGSHVRSDGFITNSQFNTTTENILASYAPSANDTLTLKLINNDLDTRLPLRLSLNQFRLNPFQRGCDAASAAATAAGCGTLNLFRNGANGATLAQTASQALLGRDDRRTILGARWEHSFGDETTWRTQAVFDNKDISQPTGATSARGDSPAFNLSSDVTRHGSLAGFDAVHFGGLFFEYERLSNDTLNVTPGGGLGALTATQRGHHYNLGARAREEVKFTPAWSAVAGVGVELTDIDAANTAFGFPLAGAPTTTVTAAHRRFYNLAPEAALLYRPGEDWLLHTRVATGYGTPQAGNLFVTPAGLNGNNTQLQSQKNLGVDVGADGTLGTLRVSATGFYEFFKNELVTQSPGAGLQNFTFNAPRSEHRGVELMAEWRPAPGWRLMASYIYDDQVYTRFVEQLSAGARTARFDRAGKKIPGVEPNFLFARAGYDMPAGPLTGLGGFVDVTWRDAFFLDNANLVKAPGYAVVNLNLHYAPEIAAGYVKGFELYFEVLNLFNKTYVASANNIADSLSAASGLQNGPSVLANATGSIFAGAPRSFVGGMRFKF